MTEACSPVITSAADLNRLPERTLARLEPAAADVPALCVVKIDGEFRALADRCPHRGVSLSAGILDGTVVTCRAHGLRFDLRTGKSVQGFSDAATPYTIAVLGDRISASRAGRWWLRLLSRRRARAGGDRQLRRDRARAALP